MNNIQKVYKISSSPYKCVKINLFKYIVNANQKDFCIQQIWDLLMKDFCCHLFTKQVINIFKGDKCQWKLTISYSFILKIFTNRLVNNFMVEILFCVIKSDSIIYLLSQVDKRRQVFAEGMLEMLSGKQTSKKKNLSIR